MTLPQGVEARVQPRVKVSWRAQVVVEGRTIEGRAIDISEGGVGLNLEDTVAAGQAVRVNLLIHDPRGAVASQVISGTIRVAFAVLSQGGVRTGGPWLELPMAARSLLGSYVRQQAFKIT
jgi:c-di-GMP-binding flagellar brake protein YcgR